VLAWISPTPDGRLPPVFEPVLDELGFIAVSADSAGNDRPLTDRLQLVLDGIETVRRSWLIDPVRTYVSGFSGGGRCAAILQLALPDVFCGAVPVGGVDSHHNAPTGRGDSFWPARLGKPLANDMRSLRDRRIGVIVGELDVNRAEAAVRVDLMKADGIPARLDVMPGLGHALPPAPGFAESLRWVDEPPREARKAAVDEASKRLGRVEPDPDERAALIGVVRTAPWSDPAWTAAERLGYSRERFLNGHP
jgi:predicted esterase